MEILIVAHYQGDGFPSAIFIHEQVKEFVEKGCKVRMVVPIPFGKYNDFSLRNKRFGKFIEKRIIDEIEIFFVRYITFSRFGENYFNHRNCIKILDYKIESILKNFEPDIIHAHTIGFDSEIGVWFKERLGIPLVVTTHGSDTSLPIMKSKFKLMKSWCDKIDVIVAVSSALKKRLELCDTKTSIKVIMNGFLFNFDSKTIKKNELSVIQVGNLIKQKCTDVTIKAFAKIKKKYPSAILKIIGDGPEKKSLEDLCDKMGVSENVFFLGKLANSNVLEEMKKSQFFCMPSVREGFGIVYLEAMSSGCISIGTLGEGIEDLIVDGVNGFLVPPYNDESIFEKIEKCLNDSQMSIRVANNAISSARNFTWNNNALNYIELFNDITKSSK